MNDANGGEVPAQILVVEDHALMRATLCTFLTDAFPEVAIHSAENGARAMASCQSIQPQLVLMDVRLPDANGIDLTAQIKKSWPQIKVIVVSSLRGEPYVSYALAAGAERYVVKDHLFAQLIPAVENALGILSAAAAV